MSRGHSVKEVLDRPWADHPPDRFLNGRHSPVEDFRVLQPVPTFVVAPVVVQFALRCSFSAVFLAALCVNPWMAAPVRAVATAKINTPGSGLLRFPVSLGSACPVLFRHAASSPFRASAPAPKLAPRLRSLIKICMRSVPFIDSWSHPCQDAGLKQELCACLVRSFAIRSAPLRWLVVAVGISASLGRPENRISVHFPRRPCSTKRWKHRAGSDKGKSIKAQLTFIAGLAVGYVVGTRVGRRGYESLKHNARALWETDVVQDTVQNLEDSIKAESKDLGSRLVDRVAGRREAVAAGHETLPDVDSDPALTDEVGQDWADEGGALPSDAGNPGWADEHPLEAPSTDAPINEDNADSARPDHESFSSEPDEDASGD